MLNLFGNKVEKLNKDANNAEKKALIEKQKLLHNLQNFLSKDQLVTQETKLHEGRSLWTYPEKFAILALPAEQAKEKAEEFVKFYETSLKQDIKVHICEIVSKNNANNIVFINDGYGQEPIRYRSKRIKELDKLAKSYGKIVTKHWGYQKQLGVNNLSVLNKDGSR